MTYAAPELEFVAKQVVEALSRSIMIGTSAYITTSASYPNGNRVVVRLDQHGPEQYCLSDDGHACLEAEMLGGLAAFHRLSHRVAEQAGVGFDHQAFYASRVTSSQLPGAVVAVANASHRSVERTLYVMEERRVARSREVFVERIKEAFGSRAVFDADINGRSGREWRMDAAIEKDNEFKTAFALVRPSTIGVATAHLKCSDIRLLMKPPIIVAALSDYARTSPELRLLLSDATNSVIAANDDMAAYLRVG